MTRNVRARLRQDRRPTRRLGVWCFAAAALLALLTGNLWFHSAPGHDADVPLAQLKAAYAQVVPGETQVRELAPLGFDAARPGVVRLSYLGLMEYFAPRDSAGFDRLAPQARKCLSTPDGCSAYVFRLARAAGSEHQAAFSFINAAAAAGTPNVEVLFLIHDGRVAYKAMTGV
jgi:hypothetical protein